jgi:hypothetical protein
MANFCHLLAKSANVSRSSEVEALFERVAHTRAISKNFFGPLIFWTVEHDSPPYQAGALMLAVTAACRCPNSDRKLCAFMTPGY